METNNEANVERELNGKPMSATTRPSSNKIHPFVISEPGQNQQQQVEAGIKDTAPSDTKDAAERDNWTGKLDFFLSALSYSVGLGAVWRFPYLCYENGGGAFLIPFVIFIVLVGVPLMFLELAVGQFASRGPVHSWVMVPMFKGIGISMNIINNYVNIYYIMIIGYSMYFLFLSLRTVLPWERCNPEWMSPNCVDDFRPAVFNFTKCDESKYLFFQCNDGKCYINATMHPKDVACAGNRSLLTSTGYSNPIYPSQDYWNNVVLRKTPSINETGELVWQLVVALSVAWVTCFLSLFRGVKLSGKIVYFTGLFPYLVLFILGIRGWTLDGAEIGLKYYLEPNLEKLADPKVWNAAAVQVFFTFSLSYGGLIALSSYNKFNHNILRDTLVLSLSNFLTCILAGLVVFAYMGSLAKQTGLDITKVVQSGQGLVYVVYPYAVTTLSAAPVWSVMFFVMMLALGMGTMMASVETLTTTLEDFFPVLKRTPRIKAITLAIICAIYFVIDLLLCSQAGTYWITLLDDYSANWAILMIAFVECICIGWLYGVDRFKTDVSAMVGLNNTLNNRIFIWWKICWMFVTPIMLLALMIFSWQSDKAIDGFPEWTRALGHALSGSSMIGIIGWMVYALIDAKKNKKPMSELITPSDEWRPMYDKDNDVVNEAHSQRKHTYRLIC